MAGSEQAGKGPVRLGKRQLIQAAGGFSLAFLLGVTVRSAASEPVLRPPGVKDEKTFLALCLRCSRCETVCPTKVIHPARWGQGLVHLRTPVLGFEHGFCDFCGKCIDACPTGALDAERRQERRIGVAELTDACIALRTSACTKCAEVCPEGAITLNKIRVPQIDAERCTGCGACVTNCPANIYQSYSGNVRGIVVVPAEARK
ncbi:MAG: 4Fe-4S dicluster domain-containing protein [Duodenibacillus sp.]